MNMTVSIVHTILKSLILILCCKNEVIYYILMYTVNMKTLMTILAAFPRFY